VSEEPLASATPRGPGYIRSPVAILALLTTLNLLNYLDRYVLAAVLPKMQEELGLSNVMGGWLATVFLVGYFATSPVFGALADRVGTGGRKRLMMIGVSVWSAATLATGLVHGAAALVAARAAVGVGEASYATIAPTLIDDLATPAQRGRWMAVFNAAIPVGSALGFVVGGAVEHAHGWHAAFFVAGTPGILFALLCLLIAEPVRRGAASRDLFASARALLRIPLYRGAVLGYCAHTFAIGGFAYWAPKYLHARYALEPGRASEYFGLVTVVSGLVGTLVGGWLADRAARRRPEADRDTALVRASLSVCALSAGLGAPLAAAAILAGTAPRFFAFVVPCEVAIFLSSGPINLALLRSVPAGLRASAVALGIFFIHLLGDMWSPLLIGFLADGTAGSRDSSSEASRWVWAMMTAPVVFAAASIVWWRASTRLTDAVAVR
jgi:MFS family permease